MPRTSYLVAGVAGYLLAIVPMLYFVGFVAGRGVPKSVDSGPAQASSAALAVDLALLVAFAVVHSALARPAGKRAIERLVPASLARSLYSAVAGLQIVLLMALWQPLPEPVWSLSGAAPRAAAWALYGAGWALVVWALAAIGSGHLFGLRQAWAAARDRPYAPPELRPRGPYRWLRHPLYAGTILALFAAAEMSRGRLLLAVVLTTYMLVGARFEERELERQHGEAYRLYRASVPAYLPTRFGSPRLHPEPPRRP